MKTKATHKTHVSKKKIEGLSEITKLAKESRTILVASIKIFLCLNIKKSRKN